MWAVWFSSMDQRLYIALVGNGTCAATDDLVSASLFERLSVFLENQKYIKQKTVSILCRVGTMCRGSNVKDKHASAFQLESLILAQNERWRQA